MYVCMCDMEGVYSSVYVSYFNVECFVLCVSNKCQQCVCIIYYKNNSTYKAWNTRVTLALAFVQQFGTLE